MENTLPKNRTRVLILWDQDFPSLVLANHLEKKGFDIRPVTRMSDIKSFLQPGQVVLVDEKFIESFFQKNQDLDRQPVIVLIGPQKPDLVRKALQQGASDFISKPVDLDLAEARIRIQIQLLETTQALEISRQRYELALEGTSDGIWDWDIHKGTVFYSLRWKAMLGFKEEEIGEALEDWLDRIHPDDIPRVQKSLEDCIRGGAFLFSEEYRVRHRDGSFRWFLSRGVIRTDQNGTPIRMVGAQMDLTYRGVHDEMTGLPKRTLFLESLNHALSRSRSSEKPWLAVLELSLDRFATITTTYGDYIGDQVILKFTDLLRRELVSGNVLARLEGANFVCVMDGLQTKNEATQFAKNVLAKISNAFEIFDQRIRLQLTIGIAFFKDEAISAENLLRHAHAALIHAKRKPHGGYEIFQPFMQQEVEENLEIENHLRSAVAKKELNLHFQPQVDALSHKVIGVETLLRWNNTNLGEVGPLKFIPVAESSGDIIEIGFWVLDEAIRTVKHWESKGIEPLRLAVNLSGHQIKYPGLVDKVGRILEQHDFNPNQLALELTESILMDQTPQTFEVLEGLNNLGIALEIDDFGTGYSSLSYLARFPVRALKIDRAFVIGLPERHQSMAITRAIVNMGTALGLSIVAEGVENQDQARVLAEMGCHSLQGYLFSPPLDAKKIVKTLKKLGVAVD